MSTTTDEHPTGKPPENRLRIENRFFEKVDHQGKCEDECWEWTAATNQAGYGQFRVDGTEYAHRVAYELLVGDIDDDDDDDGETQINHTCDNRSCVNPNHLYKGTQEQNVRDSIVRGDRDTSLSDDEVREIRQKYDADDGDVTLADLEDEYGLSYVMIHRVATGESYTHID